MLIYSQYKYWNCLMPYPYMLKQYDIDLFLRPCLCYQLQSIAQNMYVLL